MKSGEKFLLIKNQNVKTTTTTKKNVWTKRIFLVSKSEKSKTVWRVTHSTNNNNNKKTEWTLVRKIKKMNKLICFNCENCTQNGIKLKGKKSSLKVVLFLDFFFHCLTILWCFVGRFEKKNIFCSPSFSFDHCNGYIHALTSRISV